MSAAFKQRQLGLIGLPVGLFCLLASPAMAQDGQVDPAMDAVIACQAELNNQARLACYDRTVADLRALRPQADFGLPPAPQPDPLIAPVDEPDTEPARDTVKADSKFKRIEVPIVRTERFGSNRTRFYLDNGQIWEQTESDSVYLPSERDGRRNTAAIRRTIIGSHMLRVNGKGRSIRVKRIK